jgi:DNA-binding transcriptional ArsR family regulator
MVRPWNSNYEDIILWNLLKEQGRKRVVTKHGIPFQVDIVKKSYTELYEMVMRERKDAKKKKGLSHETFRNHLNRLLRSHVLRKYPQKGRRQVYGLDSEKYLDMKTQNLNLSPEELDRRILKVKYGLP